MQVAPLYSCGRIPRVRRDDLTLNLKVGLSVYCLPVSQVYAIITRDLDRLYIYIFRPLYHS